MRVSSASLVVLSAWASRLAAAACMLYSLRLLNRALTPSDYAVFIIISGLAGWFALADAGLGYSTQNAVTRRLATGNSAAREILSGYILLLLVFVLVTAVACGASGPMAQLLFSKIPATDGQPDHARTLAQAVALLAFAGAAAMSSKILYGTGRGYVANLATALGTVAGVLILAAGIDDASHKVRFALAALYGPNALLAGFICLVQMRQAVQERPGLERPTFVALWRGARGFLAFNFVAALVLQIDYIVMSQHVEPQDIVQYYSLAKAFTFVAFFNQAILFAAWPRFTARFELGEYQDVGRLLRRLVVSSAVVTAAATAVILLTRSELRSMLAPAAAADFRPAVVIGFGMLALLRCLTDPFAIFLQSIGRTLPLTLIALMQAVVGGVLQWSLAGSYGIEGVLVALNVSFLSTVGWALPWLTQRILKSPHHTKNNPHVLPDNPK